MTRRDIRLIANVLRISLKEEAMKDSDVSSISIRAVRDVAERFKVAISAVNPRFNEDKWNAALIDKGK